MAFKCVNCGENHASYNKKCSFYRREYDIQSIRVSNVSFFEDRIIHQQTHGQRVMNYAGAVRAPIQSASVCTQTDVSWVVTRKQRSATPVSSRPVPSFSRSVGTATRVADVKKTMAPAKSSPPNKGVKPNKPSSRTQQVEPVHDAYFTVKKGKVRRVPLLQMCKCPQFSLKLLF